MRFVTFRTPKPKQFTYKPRYYNEEIEALEKRKAELGYDSKLSHQDSLKLQMSKRWRKSERGYKRSPISQLTTYLVVGFIIVGGIYLIFFTDFVEKFIALFGIR
jgi:hypothetical protein